MSRVPPTPLLSPGTPSARNPSPRAVLLRFRGGRRKRGAALPLGETDRRKNAQCRALAPCSGAPLRGDAEWHIGIGHGHFLHPDAGTHGSYHIYEQHLAVLDHDYIALGHWEQQTRVAAGDGPVAAYSGAPDGLAGKTGGAVLLVHLESDGRVRLESHPVQPHRELMHHDDLPLLYGKPLPESPRATP